MKENNRLSIELSNNHIAACNSCYAHTHETSSLHSIGEKVDRLYELQIGSMVMTLCDKCLDELVEKIINRPKEVQENG